jgi:hypothetical protein
MPTLQLNKAIKDSPAYGMAKFLERSSIALRAGYEDIVYSIWYYG